MPAIASAARLTALLVLTSLAACESASDRAQKNSPDYKAGYSDGCASANSQGADMRRTSRVRDAQSYGSNRAYRVGWDSGFNACRSYQGPSAGPALPDQGPIPDPSNHPF